MAIPLESFIHASRTVIGITVMWLLRLFALALRLLGNTSYYCGRVIISLYDLLIFPLLWAEEKMSRPRPAAATVQASKEVPQ